LLPGVLWLLARSRRLPGVQEARKSKKSAYRDWYVWSKKRPENWKEGVVFPGVQDSTWTYDEKAKEYFFHRFYDFQPDLNTNNPKVREEIKKIMGYWLQMGVTGFRLDAVPFIIETPDTGGGEHEQDFELLKDMRKFLQWRKGDAIMLGERGKFAFTYRTCISAFAGGKSTPGSGIACHYR